MTTTDRPAEPGGSPLAEPVDESAEPTLTRAERRLAARGGRQPKPQAPTRMRELDLLRFIAAMAVVFFHYTARQNPAWGDIDPVVVFPTLSEVSRYGFLGVELFFIISGFVILMTAWGRGVGEFAIARGTRLFPAYLFAVLFTAFVVTVVPDLGYKVEPLQVVTNLTMLQSGLGVADVDGVYWSLWVELRFYVLIALLVLYGVTYRSVVGFMTGWLVITVALRAAPVPFLDFFFFPRWSHFFIAGMALFLVRRFGSNLVLWSIVFVCWVLTLTAAEGEIAGAERIVGATINPAAYYGGITAIFLVMILVALGALKWVSWRGLTTLGLLTYPLYLLHEWVGWVMIDQLNEQLGGRMTLIVVTLSMLLLSWFVARFIEAPSARRMRAALNRALVDMRANSERARG
jgi:peptidoglycan/LPS O-acetylase OafA/YrhL